VRRADLIAAEDRAMRICTTVRAWLRESDANLIGFPDLDDFVEFSAAMANLKAGALTLTDLDQGSP
jgi:hypothetical protein